MANILVVDDSKLMRTAITNTIHKLGYKVIGEAKNGFEAIEKFAELSPDLVLLDVNMPGICGIETAKRITTEHKNAKVVMVSARGEYELITQALISGAKSYISKPVGIENLQDTIKALMSDQKTNTKVLIADSAIVYRKILKTAILPLNLGEIIEAKDSLEAIIAIEKNPDINLIILSEELLGLPSKNLLQILAKKSLISGRSFIFLHSGGSVLEAPKGIDFLGTVDRGENAEKLQAEFRALIDPKPSTNPQFIVAFQIAQVYLANNIEVTINKPKLIRIANRYFDTEEEMSDEDLFSIIEYMILDYFYDYDEGHKIKRLELRELLDISTQNDIFLPLIPSEDTEEPASPFESDEARKEFLISIDKKKIPVDKSQEDIARMLFAKIIDFANSCTDDLFINKKINYNWQNINELIRMISKNHRIIPHKYLLPYRQNYYNYLHDIAVEIDQPVLFEIEDKIVDIEKIKSRLKTIIELGSKTLFDRVFLPNQPTFWHLEKYASAELIEPYLEDNLTLFKQELISHITIVKKLLETLLDFYTNYFYNTLLDLARRNSKIANRFFVSKINPDLQIYNAVEYIIQRDKKIENSEALLAKAKQISTRHFVLATANMDLTEQFKLVINKTNLEWKFNRIADANMLLKWLQGNHPTHLLLDIKLFEIANQPSFGEFINEINAFKSYFKILVLLPSELENKEIYLAKFREIIYPIDTQILTKRLLQT